MKFEKAVQAMSEGKQVRRSTWEGTGFLYADEFGQFKMYATDPRPHSEDWILDVQAVSANDWETVEPVFRAA